MEQLRQVTSGMASSGVRRMLVIAGDATWSSQQVDLLVGQIPGDWLWVGVAPELPLNCSPSAVRTLLGREFLHAVFDARSGLDAEALAAVAGTLKAGSWLVLLAPDWERWPTLPDADSSRWSDRPQAIATPNFITHLQQCVLADSESFLWQQHHPLRLPEFSVRPEWHPANGAPEQEQADILAALHTHSSGVAVVTAPRGRGKSALAGMLIRSLEGEAIVTAPTRAATDVLAIHAGEKFNFVAPDSLLIQPEIAAADWLVIDEAAALPAPQLRKLIALFPRTLLTTTVQGYEGTGRGFLLKFCAGIDCLVRYTLSTPVRWAANDPLENLIDNILLFDEADITTVTVSAIELNAVEQRDSEQLQQMYRLLSGAHYRTSPLDWRRMLDAPGQHFIAASADDDTVGAAWLVEEGGLVDDLSRAVWAGFRRPRGNLVAQSLAAHGGSPLAATLRGLRVTRIAVHPLRQRQQIGQQMIAMATVLARRSFDYLSVSFGYTDELWTFWESCGFVLVRVGSHKEASSGCYTAMALLPLSEEGEALTRYEEQRLARDITWLQPWIDEPLPVIPAPEAALSHDDWYELAGFAFAHRPVEACLGSLNRLLQVSELPLNALRSRVQKRLTTEQVCERLRLSGRKALLTAMRQEVEQALDSLDKPQSEALKAAVTKYD
ncbi:GNAT family N-acetyltransferase [Enterobacteriaceae bacterium H11S18]|uniref:tRNA(Met) cytidine acetyltransferase TmcA n=1 Tax=Dryocola clanedunensis TaxID=2925396 RepID=UPI0022F12A59|nr:GNAT family N-acetyltransferase [Dryocola clanedunensis]MCT4712651.1 GNAT family N-acetyltransferase [Dryocola clanedunensis]